MQIPHPLPSFARRTLIVVSDRMHAKLFIGDGQDFSRIDEITTNQFPLDDTKKTVSTEPGTGMTSVGIDEKIKDHVGDAFFKQLANIVSDTVHEKSCTSIILVISHEYKHELENALPKPLRALIERIVPKTLTNMPESELLEPILHVELPES